MGSQAHLQVPVALQMHEGWSQHMARLKYLVTGGAEGLSDNKNGFYLGCCSQEDQYTRRCL